MIKTLKLRKAVLAIILGIVALIVAKVMSNEHITGSSYVLGFSGFLLIIGAMLFLYPILFAKKVVGDRKIVELKPVEGKQTDND